jgi:uncharacterized membrane protein YfcA
MQADTPARRHRAAFGWGAAIGTLGGLIGLGGAEFRLPVLAGIFRLRMLDAIRVNLVVSLVTVVFAFGFRTGFTGLEGLLPHAGIAIHLLVGALLGAWLGVQLATRISERLLTQVVVVCLVLLGLLLMGHQALFEAGALGGPPALRLALGLLAGVVIGAFSSLLGVAGGELIIPTLVLLYGLDIKTAGSLSLAISAPTLVMGITRYRARGAMRGIGGQGRFIGWMAAGSVLGALLGAALLVYVPAAGLRFLLGIILLASAWKLARMQLGRRSAPLD